MLIIYHALYFCALILSVAHNVNALVILYRPVKMTLHVLCVVRIILLMAARKNPSASTVLNLVKTATIAPTHLTVTRLRTSAKVLQKTSCS